MLKGYPDWFKLRTKCQYGYVKNNNFQGKNHESKNNSQKYNGANDTKRKFAANVYQANTPLDEGEEKNNTDETIQNIINNSIEQEFHSMVRGKGVMNEPVCNFSRALIQHVHSTKLPNCLPF